MSSVHVVLTGVVDVGTPPGEAFELFTPEGERRWADGWDPIWVQPSVATLTPGAVFRTTDEGEETLWLVVDVDRAAGRVRYVRHTPGSRIGSVEVRCAPMPGGGTAARVTYDVTALSPAGQRYLAEFESAYVEMLASWKRDIARALEREWRAHH
jgi:hypothetical protein